MAKEAPKTPIGRVSRSMKIEVLEERIAILGSILRYSEAALDSLKRDREELGEYAYSNKELDSRTANKAL